MRNSEGYISPTESQAIGKIDKAIRRKEEKKARKKAIKEGPYRLAWVRKDSSQK